MNIEYWALGISLTLLIAGLTLAFRIGKWKGEVDTDRKNFKDFMKEVKDDIKKILERLPPPRTADSTSTIGE